MKNYKTLSKVILAVCLIGIVLAVVNYFTGFINATLQVSGTLICIMGFMVAGISTIILENNRMKKSI